MAIYKGEVQMAGVNPVDSSLNKSSNNAVSNYAITTALDNIKTELFDAIYPVGSIYVSIGETLPESFKGTWERLPNEYYLVSSDVSQGTMLEPELPNIKGSVQQTGGSDIGFNPSSMWEESGALAYTTRTYNGFSSNSSSSKRVTGFVFNANTYDATYKDDGKVQPRSVQCSMWKRTA